MTCGVAAACDPRSVSSPRVALEPQAFEEFAPEKLDLYSNTLLLWRSGVSGTDVNEVIAQSKAKDAADVRGTQVQKELDALMAEMGPQASKWVRKFNQLQVVLAEKAKLEEQLTRESDPDRRSAIESDLTALSRRGNRLREDLNGLEEEYPVLKSAGPRYAALTERASVESRNGRAAIARIVAKADFFFEQPKAIAVDFVGETPQVEIRDWVFAYYLPTGESAQPLPYRWGDKVDHTNPRTFSSRAGDIQNVSYQKRGGILEFDLVVRRDLPGGEEDPHALRNERWHFRMARTLYRKTKETGRIFFSGAVTRTRSVQAVDTFGSYCSGDDGELSPDGKDCVRRGILKVASEATLDLQE
jgi:hypothetical protein